ncbi:uncharacterized protein SCDLUD_002240 [Saccharomycodes ludwigii]|uniref:uncharacterized protein n=1 Tax=Saccharomycodes ludwigii TaxID=36035 RepID=UPI001E865FF5|nr:hypothetical protein SCDLUD_002240 [Saccharomycodes ludwigii]KAH3902418.1 hypothetical protein SCDLUD_002240 [Saccharomycodes ludwigii]
MSTNITNYGGTFDCGTNNISIYEYPNASFGGLKNAYYCGLSYSYFTMFHSNVSDVANSTAIIIPLNSTSIQFICNANFTTQTSIVSISPNIENNNLFPLDNAYGCGQTYYSSYPADKSKKNSAGLLKNNYKKMLCLLFLLYFISF